MNEATLGGIVHCKTDKYGFRVAFETVKEANKYKDMLRYILRSDEYSVGYEVAKYDNFRPEER